jgi:hypothetical protein
LKPFADLDNVMDLSQFKDAAEAAAAVTTTLALILGGIWAYWRLIFQREREPRAEFDVFAEFVGMQDGKWLLEVSARLANRGQVRHLMKNATLNIRYLKAGDPIVESDDPKHFRQIVFPNALGRRPIWWDSYIDPGLEFRNSYIAWVPSDATYVLLLCKFEYGKDTWPAQRLARVPSRPAENVDLELPTSSHSTSV